MGVAVNPGAPELEHEISRFEWKVDAGAEFAVTQPIFDVAVLAAFLKRIGHVRIPVIAGVWPLTSYRNGEFLNNEVPGVVVPPPVLERMRAAGDGEAGAREGIAIAREILEQLAGLVEGVQVATPMDRFESALAVTDGFHDVRATSGFGAVASAASADENGRPEGTERAAGRGEDDR